MHRRTEFIPFRFFPGARDSATRRNEFRSTTHQIETPPNSPVDPHDPAMILHFALGRPIMDVIGDRRLTAHRTIAEPPGGLPVIPRRDRTALAVIACALAMIVTAGCPRKDPLPAEDPARQTIRLKSTAFEDGGMIPKTFTCDGSDRSPPLEWSGVPESTRSLVLICDDPDAPIGTWSHWVVFNVAPQVRALKEGVPPGETIAATAADEPKAGDDNSPRARQGTNDFSKLGYGGPCPPSGTHRYFFRLYALDIQLDLGSSAKRSQVLKAIEGHILAEGRLMGKYKRAA